MSDKLKELEHKIRHRILTRLRGHVINELEPLIDNESWDKIHNSMGKELDENTYNQIWHQVSEEIRESLPESIK